MADRFFYNPYVLHWFDSKTPFTMLKFCVGFFLKSISGYLQNPKCILLYLGPHN